MESLFDTCLDHRYNGSYRWKQPAGQNHIIGMDTADMDYQSPPCLRPVLSAVAEENTFNYRGIPDHYYAALQSFYLRKYNLTVPMDWISSAPGTIGAIRMALDLYAKRGSKVIMQAPYFSPLKRAVEGAGCELLLNQMTIKNGRFELDIDDFEEKIIQEKPSLFLMVNPHNPTGRVFTKPELERMISICHQHGVAVISDEVHSLITYDGHRHIPVLSLGREAQEIAVQIVSVSKAFNMMALPHAIVAIANQHMMEEWKQNLASYSFSYAYNAFTIPAVASVLSGAADEWLESASSYLTQNRNRLFQAFSALAPAATPYMPEASYLMWVDCSHSGLNVEKLDEEFLIKAGIRLNNGLDHGKSGRGFVRINFALTKDHLESAISRLEQVLHIAAPYNDTFRI